MMCVAVVDVVAVELGIGAAEEAPPTVVEATIRGERTLCADDISSRNLPATMKCLNKLDPLSSIVCDCVDPYTPNS